MWLFLCWLFAVPAWSFFQAPPRMRSRVVLGDRVKEFEEETGRTVFDALVEYPCDFQIKVIGREDATFVDDMVGRIAAVTKTEKEAIRFKTQPSSKGTFVSVSILAPVEDADTLYECYATLRDDDRVKLAL